MEDRYVAAMVLAGVGDAMGFKNGEWEFNFDGEAIHEELKQLGGVPGLKIKKPDWIVSDDTVLLLSTAEALVKESTSTPEKLYAELAYRYKHDFVRDMAGRSGGITTASSCAALKPDAPLGWQIPFNPRGGGCGAAMRAMCIGLRYPDYENESCLEKLIAVSVESGRMTHNHPTGYLGSFASALFTALSVNDVPVRRWGHILLSLLDKVWSYVEQAGIDVDLNRENWSYFSEQWKAYLSLRQLENGESDAVFPAEYGIKERDAFYKSLAFNQRWGGASGHDAPMISYDALLFAGGDWTTLCHHGMLHSGDNDSTGVIAGCCYGARYGLTRVPASNHKNVEYRSRLVDCGKKLYKLAVHDRKSRETAE